MAKNKGTIIIGGVALLAIGGIWAVTRLVSNSKSREATPLISTNQIERSDTAPTTSLTVDQATEIVAHANNEPVLYDLYKDYYTNNMIFDDPEAPFNQGSEALYAFVARFARDAQFQRERSALVSDASRPEYGSISLSVSEPDSTNFFSAWRELAENNASFCRGFLGSEMIEEYVFTRKNNRSPWYLVDYFRADEIIY